MKIYLIGDIGCYNYHTIELFSNLNKKIEKEDIIILLGDNFYPVGVYDLEDEMWKEYKGLKINNPVYAILGNHDYLGNPLCQTMFKEWNMPDIYYRKTFDDIDIFFIDTNVLIPNYSNLNFDIVKNKIGNPNDKSEEMINWLKKNLSNSSKKFKMICGHYPIVSFGRYKFNKQLLKIILPIIINYKVNVYASGHDHNLQIIDVKTENHNFKQIISGASSHLYSIDNDGSNRHFSTFGHIELDINDYSSKIVETGEKILFSEKLI